MDVKKIVLIVGAMILALGAAFGVNQLMRGSTAPAARAAAAPAIDGPKVIIATRALPVGTILTADSLRFQPWPEGLVKPDQYYVEGQANLAALTGSVVRVAIPSGAPVTKGALVNPSDRGFLAAALAPGMRAISIPLSAEQGVSGFVFPGDRVDLMLTMQFENQNQSDGDKTKLYTTETIVRNLRVLAVDQRSVPTDENGSSTPAVYSTVTIEATPVIAEKIAVARSAGTLSLALRSIADTQGQLEEAIASGSVSVPHDGDARGEARMLVGDDARPSDRGGSPVTGGDVSRYLRRTLPPPTRPTATGATPDAGGQNPAAAAEFSGPRVRVVRGDQVTIVPVGGN
jgi:pilus assembly protein CpaB